MRNTNIALDDKVAYTEKNLGNLDSMSSKRKITSRKNRTFLTVVKDIYDLFSVVHGKLQWMIFY